MNTSSARRTIAGSAIVGALPLPIAILMATTSGRLALAACLALPLAVLAGGPSLWPEWRRFGSLILVGPAVTTLVVSGIAFLIVAFATLCTSDQTHSYLSAFGAWAAIAAFALPYALGSAWAVAHPERVIWAWPLVILCAIVIGGTAMWILEGGVHHCET